MDISQARLKGPLRFEPSVIFRYSKVYKRAIYFEPYLKVQCPRSRIALSKMRMSAHNLAIETGRHRSQSLDDRLCKYCNIPETEMHHIMSCTKFDTLRNQLLAVCRKEIDKFDTLREERKFVKIMEVKTVALANALGQYLVQANDAMLKDAMS